MPGKRVASEDYVKNAIRNLTIKLAGARMSSGGVAGPHDLLSSVHSDVVASEPVRGDIICANSTPAWTRLPLGANGYHLRSDGNDVAWVTPAAVLAGLSGQAGAAFSWNSRNLTAVANIVINDGGTIGQAAGPLMTFDDTNNFLEITGCSVGIGTTSPYTKFDVNDTTTTVFSGTGYRLGRFVSTAAAVADQPGVVFGFDTAGAGIVAASTQAVGQPLAFWTYNGSSWGERARISKSGNVGIGQTTFGTNATKTLAIGTGVAPTTSPADCFQMFSKDVNGVADKAGAHIRNENTGVLIVPGVLIKTDTGSPAYNFEGMICINTNDNTVDMYADAGWRTLASW